MPHQALTHEQNRKKVCLWCSRKFKQMFIISNTLKTYIAIFTSKSISVTRSKINLKCDCTICEIARSQPINFSKKSQEDQVSGKYF